MIGLTLFKALRSKIGSCALAFGREELNQLCSFMPRLKSGPARLKSCPDTCPSASQTNCKNGLSNLHNLLAEILAFEQTNESGRRVLQSLHHSLTILDLLFADPLSKLSKGLRPDSKMVTDDESLKLDAIADGADQVAESVAFLGVVLGNHSAERDAGKGIASRQHRIQERPADVLEININSLGSSCSKSVVPIAAAVVDAGIKSQVAHHVIAFLFAAGNAHNSTVLDFCDLARHAANGAGGG